ncbi:ATP-binding cassette, subfamily F, member 3 [Desulfonatronum thiosulfatophilum]|uniref:ATP-binding cassette, subfamily F, member 3 n=1 Tax=Desulfonatronum thiosulfatophilum TaxID=617002 RepID=A0A1G6B7G4_9BACT|nr:ABC-F family ATP-binding cassette domain-containing protein [Desulfonatronum thiosulfatophilum]SDB16519.1 ATP-binding cassette, subfamily F, member 3 [Desulfonatronum thiosulfatophilum]
MSKLTIHALTKSYGGRDIFKDFNLEITGGTRLAVVGANGAGKSTLLRILAGESAPDSGRIIFSSGARLGYVAQELETGDLERGLLAWIMDALPSWAGFWQRWEDAVRNRDEAGLKILAEEQTILEHQLGYSPEHRAKTILCGLGFSDGALDKPLQALSGGWRERAKLARVLTAGADVLLLDEPTNHLDLEAVTWLEQYLLGFDGVLVFVAHDRVFLDKVATQTLYLGEAKPILRPGTFTQFLAWREEMEQQWERQAAAIDEKIRHQAAFIDRFRYKASKARQAQSKLKSTDKLHKELEEMRNQRPQTRARTLSFALPEPSRGDQTVLAAADLDFSFDGSPLWPPLTFQLYRGQKVALAGPNGAGKTTLLKLISGDLEPRNGRIKIGPNTVMGYFSQHQTEILNPDTSVMSEMRRLAGPKATYFEACSILGLFLLGEEYWERPVASLSGGEKSRLLLGSLFAARANFLVLDEPTNHLDLESREALIRALEEYSGTLIFVAHDRRLLAEAAQEIWAVGSEGMRVFTRGFEEYDAYRQQAVQPDCPVDQPAQNIKASRQEEKERRRVEAEQRNALSRRLKPLKEEYAKVESDLEKVLARQSELEQVLADPETYARADEFTRLSKEYHEVEQKGEKLLLRLEELEASIGVLENQPEAA